MNRFHNDRTKKRKISGTLCDCGITKKQKSGDDSTNDADVNLTTGSHVWKQIWDKDLNLEYCKNFINPNDARLYFQELEKEIEYFAGALAKVRVYGKWHELPRQQAAFGDEGVSYTFSGLTVPAMKWTPAMIKIKHLLKTSFPYEYNFCLVNRYRNGNDSMGEHRDDEKMLDKKTPIVSVSFGQHRDFIFRHKDARNGKNKDMKPMKIVLEHGSALVMHWPTNEHWYHSLPQRRSMPGVRINLTFRRILV